MRRPAIEVIGGDDQQTGIVELPARKAKGIDSLIEAPTKLPDQVQRDPQRAYDELSQRYQQLRREVARRKKAVDDHKRDVEHANRKVRACEVAAAAVQEGMEAAALKIKD